MDRSLIDGVKGFLSQEEGETLYELALETCSMGPCLEIGSYCGKSTLWLGWACQERGSVLFAVDHHRGSEEQQKGELFFDAEVWSEADQAVDTFRLFRQAVDRAQLNDTVVPVVAPSTVAARFWSTPLALVFIDGGHTYAAAYNDYACWARHIVPGGYLLIHDIYDSIEEGGQAPHHVFKMALSSGEYEFVGRKGSLGILRRYPAGVFPSDLPEKDY
ncbi:MAG: class I SAM-dependent methyltransferase [Desulfobacterales bacterium]|nr:class I SAM-dependent methyltransferase [Desulfobacterales bacterium]